MQHQYYYIQRRRGSALLVIILTSTLALIGVGVVVKNALDKQDRAVTQKHTDNLREANKSVNSYIASSIGKSLIADSTVSSISSSKLELLKASLEARFGADSKITPDFTNLASINISTLNTGSSGNWKLPTDYPYITDPFRFAYSYAQDHNDIKYKLLLGYYDANQAGIGYSTGFTTAFNVRRVAPSNFALMHLGDLDLNSYSGRMLFLKTPAYAMGSSDPLVAGWRGSSFFVNGSVLGDANGVANLGLELVKPLVSLNSKNPNLSLTVRASGISTNFTSDSMYFDLGSIGSKKSVGFVPLADKSSSKYQESSPDDVWSANQVAGEARPVNNCSIIATLSRDGNGFPRVVVTYNGTVVPSDYSVTHGSTVIDSGSFSFWKHAAAIIAGNPDGWVMHSDNGAPEFETLLRDTNGGSTVIPVDVNGEITHYPRFLSSFLGGAIRIQLFGDSVVIGGSPRSTSGDLPDYIVTFDPRCGANVPFVTGLSGRKGVFVDVQDNSLLDKSLLLYGKPDPLYVASQPLQNKLRWQYNTSGNGVEAFNTNYGFGLPASEYNTSWSFVTNGRLLIDTSSNLVSGTIASEEGELLRTSSIAVDNVLSLSHFYGSYPSVILDTQAIFKQTDMGLHRMLLASKLRPSFVVLMGGIGGVHASTYDSGVSNRQLARLLLTNGDSAGATHTTGTVIDTIELPAVNADSPYAVPYDYTHASGTSPLWVCPWDSSVHYVYVADGFPGIAYSNTLDANINLHLKRWAYGDSQGNEIRDIFSGSRGTPVYASNSFRARMVSDDAGIKARMVNVTGVNGPTDDTLLVTGILKDGSDNGRVESRCYIKAYVQWFGWENGGVGSREVSATYNLRPVFSGNVKEQIIRYCRKSSNTTKNTGTTLLQAGGNVVTVDRNGDGVPDDIYNSPKLPDGTPLFELYESLYSLPNVAHVADTLGVVKPLVFSNCPYNKLVTLKPTITSSDSDVGVGGVTFSIPGRGGPSDVSAFMSVQLSSNGFSDAIVDSVLRGKYAAGAADVISNAIGDWVTPMDDNSVYSTEPSLTRVEGAMVSANELRSSLLEQLSGVISLKGVDNTAWQAISGYGNFTGAVEYSMSYSKDTKREGRSVRPYITTTDNLNDENNYLLYGYWHTEDTKPHVSRVRIIRFQQGSFTGSSGTLSETPASGESGTADMLRALDAKVLDKLQSKIMSDFSDKAVLTKAISYCFSHDSALKFDISDTFGGLQGFSEVFVDTGSLTLGADSTRFATTLEDSVFISGDQLGHNISNGKVNYDARVYNELNVRTLGIGLVSNTTYTVTPKGTDTLPVRDAGSLKVEVSRVFTSTPISNGVATKSDLAALFSGPNLILDTMLPAGSSNPVGLLSSSLQDAITRRKVTMVLWSTAKFDAGNNGSVPKAAAIGIGTILTAADSPHVGFLQESATKLGIPARIGWNGSIRSGVGSRSQYEVELDSHNVGVTTSIYGDPLLSSNDWGSVGIATQLESLSQSSDVVERNK